MNKLGIAFVSTSRHTNFRTLARVLLYGHVVHVSSNSLVLVSRHKRIATVGDFYTGNAMQGLGVQLFSFNSKTVATATKIVWLVIFTLRKAFKYFSF
jgi:hypothetical protein